MPFSIFNSLLYISFISGTASQVQPRSWGAGSSSAETGMSRSAGWASIPAQTGNRTAFGQMGTVMQNMGGGGGGGSSGMYMGNQQTRGVMMNTTQMSRQSQQEPRFDAYKQMSGSSMRRY